MRLFRAEFESPGPIPDLQGKVVNGVSTALRLLGEEARATEVVNDFNDFKLEIEATSNRVTFIIDVDPTSSYPMSRVHAMASQIHYCLVRLISGSRVRFSVKTKVYERELEDFMRAITQDEHFYEPENIWVIATNRRVITDIADWLRTIGPIYEDCFVSLERYNKAEELFNPLTIEHGSIKNALSVDNYQPSSPFPFGKRCREQRRT